MSKVFVVEIYPIASTRDHQRVNMTPARTLWCSEFQLSVLKTLPIYEYVQTPLSLFGNGVTFYNIFAAGLV